MRFIVDIESTDLLQNGLSYLTMPYRLKPEYKVHCVVIRHVDSGAIKTLVGNEITKDNLKHSLRKCTEIIGHNIIGFDLPVLQLYGVLDYSVGYPGEPSMLFGNPVKITDTLLWSKLLNADRFGGHRLDAWGKRLGNHKGNFNDWAKFSQEMLDYCVQDTGVNKDILLELIREQGATDWSRSYSMEVKLADLTLKQELFGFDFNTEAAKKSLVELNGFMETIAKEVDPLLPMKRMPKTESSKYIPPKIKFKKDGSISSNLTKFLTNYGCVLSEDKKTIEYEGKVFDLFSDTPIKSETKANIEDIDVVKGYLLSLGWIPSEVKDRDITKKTDKTVRTQEEILIAVDRYIDQTLNSVFKQLRLDILECSEKGLKKHLLGLVEQSKPGLNKWGKPQAQKPIWLPTTPKLTVGVEKEICPNLIELGEKAQFVKGVVEYYTYRHRRNSIAGGAVDEDGEPMTGFLSYVREDGRIPTPADTLGANTGRYRHKIVCNIPRVTSIYGEQMRNLFGCGEGYYQLGFDFASLEARIMGHFVIPYKDGESLAEALVAEKPNDIHSLNAKKLGIDRSAAKSFSYAAIYGAQPKKLSKMLGISEEEGKRLFNEYWEAVPALKQLKEKIEKDWESSGKKFIKGLDGRLLGTRSKHSLINVLFQSGGAISAKWTTVYLAKMLEERGLLGNPFVDVKDSVKAYLLIAMHDEAQLAVHPSLMKVRTFQSEAEAKTALVQGCSAVGHGSKGSYIGYETEPVVCIRESIAAACTELDLNVELGFEWIPGLTWGQCH